PFPSPWAPGPTGAGGLRGSRRHFRVCATPVCSGDQPEGRRCRKRAVPRGRHGLAGQREMTVTLRPMAAAEFPTYRERLLEAYSADIARARGLPAGSALRQTTQQTDELLPHGVCTYGQLLFIAVDDTG